VLLVDDSESDLERRRAVLQAAGYVVLTASDADRAHRVLQETAVDCVIVDHPLPGISIEREVAHLREFYPEVRILLTSAYPGTVPETAAQKADGLIHKGAPTSELVAMLSQFAGPPSQLRWPLARLAPRYPVVTPVHVSVFRSGQPFSSQGESTDLGETGMGLVLHTNLQPGEFVSLRFTVPTHSDDLVIRAVVRHRVGDHYGFEFIDPSRQQVEAIRSLCSVLTPVNTPHP
jgi:CheY-like chemotaxis protein